MGRAETAVPDPSDAVHERHMKRALALVARSRHRTNPNPKVGCVVVRDGAVVGTGVSAAPGGPHAEVNALRAAGERARGADVYVTLEPCCHHGRTPPCTEALLAAGVRRVFVGVSDPNPKVNGGGVAHLGAVGIEVHLGILGEACAAEHAAFARFITTGRPWVALKAAISLDGRIATAEGDSKWITGPKARADVHRVRAAHDAVLVGFGTARADDPRLNVRDAQGQPLSLSALGGSAPLRAALDPRLELPLTAHLMAEGTFIYHGLDCAPARVAAVAATGAVPVAVPEASSHPANRNPQHSSAGGHGAGLDLEAVLRHLASVGVVRLLVEGGGRLHGALLQARLADEGILYVAPRILGRGRPVFDLPSVPTVAEGYGLVAPEVRRFGPDLRIRGALRYPPPPSGPPGIAGS
jgi:diaminohydroxyphosphoribosylaminopyrimidine deaminase/5-amino-6-(5-phosphoribosylamino)uracil reductase